MWCGVVWCGVVWCGVVWCGVVWCGVVWCGVVWCGMAWGGVVWCGLVWLGLGSPFLLYFYHGMYAGCSMMQHDLIYLFSFTAKCINLCTTGHHPAAVW